MDPHCHLPGAPESEVQFAEIEEEDLLRRLSLATIMQKTSHALAHRPDLEYIASLNEIKSLKQHAKAERVGPKVSLLDAIPQAASVCPNDAISYFTSLPHSPEEMDEWSKHLGDFWAWLSSDSLETSYYAGVLIVKLFNHVRVANRQRSLEECTTAHAMPPQNLSIWMRLLNPQQPPTETRPSNDPLSLEEEQQPFGDSGTESLPHFTVFAWVCWEYLTCFPSTPLPLDVFEWLLNCISLQNASSSGKAIHSDLATLSTLLDTIALSSHPKRHPDERDRLTSSQVNEYALILQDLADWVLQRIEAASDRRSLQFLLKSSLKAMSELTFNQSHLLLHDCRLKCWKVCLSTLQLYKDTISNVPLDLGLETDDDVDWTVVLSSCALQTMTNLAFRPSPDDDELGDDHTDWLRDSETLDSLYPLLLVYLRPISFRQLYRKLSQHAVSLACILSTQSSCQRTEMVQEMIDSGIVLALRLQLAMCCALPCWLNEKQRDCVEQLMVHAPLSAVPKSRRKPPPKIKRNATLQSLVDIHFNILENHIYSTLKLMLPLQEETVVWWWRKPFIKFFDLLLPLNTSTTSEWPILGDNIHQLIMNTPPSFSRDLFEDKPLCWAANFWMLKFIGLSPSGAIHSISLFPSMSTEMTPMNLIAHIATRVSNVSEEEWNLTFTRPLESASDPSMASRNFLTAAHTLLHIGHHHYESTDEQRLELASKVFIIPSRLLGDSATANQRLVLPSLAEVLLSAAAKPNDLLSYDGGENRVVITQLSTHSCCLQWSNPSDIPTDSPPLEDVRHWARLMLDDTSIDEWYWNCVSSKVDDLLSQDPDVIEVEVPIVDYHNTPHVLFEVIVHIDKQADYEKRNPDLVRDCTVLYEKAPNWKPEALV